MPTPLQRPPPPAPRAIFAGAFLMLACLAAAAGGLARLVPSGTAPGALMRMLDPLAPWFLALSAGLALVAIVLGVQRMGMVLIVISLGFGAEIWLSHRAISAPLVAEASPDLRIVFFNALETNTAAADRIVDATLAADPDVAVFAEARALRPALARLQAAYAFVSPCSADACEILVAARRAPERFWSMRLNPIWHDRYAVLEIEAAPGQRLFLAASHLTKPWFSGVAEAEVERLAAQYNWLTGPVVAVGDFNMTPWSRPMRRLLRQTGLQTLRRPIGTWPAGARGFGLPIDQILVRGGPRIVAVEPFGEGLGSNHRGLVADIALGAP